MERIAIEYWKAFFTGGFIFFFIGIIVAWLLPIIGRRLEKPDLSKVKFHNDGDEPIGY